MFDDGGGYKIFLGLLAFVGIGAVAVASVALVTILTGGTGPDDVASLPAEFECDTFNGDPDIGHEAAYGITRNATITVLHSIEANSTDDGFELTFNVSDPSVLNASARQADGTPVPVEIQNTTVRVARNDTTPFRLWIDSAQGGTITRSELDICPPQNATA